MVCYPEGAVELALEPGGSCLQGQLLVDREIGRLMLGVSGWAFGHDELQWSIGVGARVVSDGAG